MAEWHLGPPEWKLETRPARKSIDDLPPARIRSAANGRPVLYGQFAAPGEWTEINSSVEGHFLERMAPTAFAKTIQKRRDRIRCLFHHGLDPAIGLKPLGPIRKLEPDSSYEVELLDAPYVNDLIPGLKAGLYGASFKFNVVRDEVRKHPVRSEHNPKALPEITVTEAKLSEFGPTPLPAYKGTTAGVRSSTREVVLETHASAYALGKRERWATRSDPSRPGIVLRERVLDDELASWETRSSNGAAWWLSEYIFEPLPITTSERVILA